MTAGRTVNSQSQHWCTPHKYIAAVQEVFGGTIQLDPCSNQFSKVGAQVEYRLPEYDGLRESWDFDTIYVNPPYGSDRERGTRIRDWLRRCWLANKEHGASVQALIPVATNTRHWKDYVWGAADAIAFLYDTRLRFLVDGEDTGKGAPMSCAMVYWGADIDQFRSVYLRHGAVLSLHSLKNVLIAADTEQPELIRT